MADFGRPVPSSCTEAIPLWAPRAGPRCATAPARLATSSGLTPESIEHLLGRYGSSITDVLDIIAERPELAGHLPGTEDYLGAEVIHAARFEGAMHLPDVLIRRTRMSIECRDRGEAAAVPVARLLARELGWTEAQVSNEVTYFLTRLQAERQSQQQVDDATADATRLGAPDLVPTVALGPAMRP